MLGESTRRRLPPLFSPPTLPPLRTPNSTGTAGVAYALWHAHRHAAKLADAVSEGELLAAAERYAAAALEGIAHKSPDTHYGWSLLAGHAGVYATQALVASAAAGWAERQGDAGRAAALRGAAAAAVASYAQLGGLTADSSVCEDDECLYGRSGYLLGALLLNRQLAGRGCGGVPAGALQAAVASIVQSGRGAAAGSGSPLFFLWHGKPYLGAAHGMIGPSACLFALLGPSRGHDLRPRLPHCQLAHLRPPLPYPSCPPCPPPQQASCTPCCTLPTSWRRCRGRRPTWREHCGTCSASSATPRGAQARASQRAERAGAGVCKPAAIVRQLRQAH